MRIGLVIILVALTSLCFGQSTESITFQHDSLTVYGSFYLPKTSAPYKTIVINAGTGANDRNSTLPLNAGNAACLFPGLFGNTLYPNRELAQKLQEAGYAVLIYDKVEYTYTTPATLGPITFNKLWLPVYSAVDYLKTRTDVDADNIILVGHSEGSSLIPYIAQKRGDIKALISIAGPSSTFDSLLAYQLVFIADSCNGNVAQATTQGNQVISYFNLIRSGNWNSSTPDLLGTPASAWAEYVAVTDSVSDYYNRANLPTLFIGLQMDYNVPPTELDRFKREVNITQDFWTIDSVVHYMVPHNKPNISTDLTDTVIYWLNNVVYNSIGESNSFKTGLKLYPNPATNEINLKLSNTEILEIEILDSKGNQLDVLRNFRHDEPSLKIGDFPSGVYWVKVKSEKGIYHSKFVKP